MDELTQTRLIVALVVAAIAGAWMLSSRAQRRKDAHFAALARAFGTEPIRVSEFHSHFTATVGQRTAEVRYQNRGGGIGSSSSGAQYVITEVPMAGVLDVHSAEIRVKQKRLRDADPRSPDFDEHVTIRDFGLPLRDGWLNQRVRTALADFYRLDFPLDALMIEEARLIHRSLAPVQRFDAATLRELLTKQVALAAVIERAL